LQGQDVTESAIEASARFEDFNMLRAAALSGQGAALCPLVMIQPDLATGAGSAFKPNDAGTV
jgi:DNA-binding transcriptional LysR family regulator